MESDRIDAAADDHSGTLFDDMVRGAGDGVEPRRAGPVQGDSGSRHRQAGEQRRRTRDIARRRHATGNHVLDLLRIDPRAAHGVRNGVSQHRHVRGIVKAAAAGLGQPGACIGNDDCLAHAGLLLLLKLAENAASVPVFSLKVQRR